MNAALLASSTRVAKSLYGRADDELPIEYVRESLWPDVFTHVSSVAPLAVKITRSYSFDAPKSKTILPSATAVALEANVAAQSMSFGLKIVSVQKSPSLASGGCSESVRPTVHAASSHCIDLSLVEMDVTASSGDVGARTVEIGYTTVGWTKRELPPAEWM